MLPGSARVNSKCFRLLARGHSNSEIAAEFVVSEATIKTHVSNLLAKLRVRDRIHSVFYAWEAGLVRPGEALSDSSGPTS